MEQFNFFVTFVPRGTILGVVKYGKIRYNKNEVKYVALDGIAVSALVYEFNNIFDDGRIDKVLQPERDEISLVIRSKGKNRRLTMSASASTPRVHITDTVKENPEKAPMFCMLLRKHLTNGKIIGFSQPDFERVLIMTAESKTELGDLTEKHLIIEIMGRHSNIILTDGENKVLGSIKHIDFSVSRVRQLIPGMLYEAPPSQGKINPLNVTKDEIFELAKDWETEGGEFLLDKFTGIGPLSARELSYRALNGRDVPLYTLNNDEKRKFADNIYNEFQKIKNNEFEPVLLSKSENKIWDFSPINITHYGNGLIVNSCESLNKAIDSFYSTKDYQERMAQKTADLMKFLSNNIKRCQKKLALQQRKLKDCENKEQDKIYGELIMGNLHLIRDNSEFAEVPNYYDNMKIIKIPLKRELSPSQNAQNYFTKYRKAQNAEVMTKEQIKLSEEELDYLESVTESLSRAENEKEITEIRDELLSQGYLVRRKEKSKMRKVTRSEPLSFTIRDGFEVFVGKNNMQNDELTLRTSKANDLWFHTKNIHGSHTVLKTNGKTPSDDVIVEAAKLCAYYSKAKNSANVPVDYTLIKYVKKPSGAKPGMVIYVNYNTVNVKPCSIEEIEKERL